MAFIRFAKGSQPREIAGRTLETTALSPTGTSLAVIVPKPVATAQSLPLTAPKAPVVRKLGRRSVYVVVALLLVGLGAGFDKEWLVAIGLFNVVTYLEFWKCLAVIIGVMMVLTPLILSASRQGSTEQPSASNPIDNFTERSAFGDAALGSELDAARGLASKSNLSPPLYFED